MERLKSIRIILIILCAVLITIFTGFVVMNGAYLNWDYSDPELVVAGTILHGFEFTFMRLAPITFIALSIGIIITCRKISN